MALDAETFYNTVAKTGLARDFLFRVKNITVEGAVLNDEAGGLIYARAAAYPGRVIEDMPVNFYGHEYHHAGRALYPSAGSYTVEFYVPGDLSVREMLEKGSRTSHEMGIGITGIDKGEYVLLEPQSPKDSSTGAIAGRPIKLHGAQIREIGDINYLIADGTGEVVVFSVTFAYQYYTLE